MRRPRDEKECVVGVRCGCADEGDSVLCSRGKKHTCDKRSPYSTVRMGGEIMLPVQFPSRIKEIMHIILRLL